MPARAPVPALQAFTLVEALLALVIAALVVAGLYALYAVAMNADHAARARSARQGEVYAGLTRLAEDVERMVAGPSSNECPALQKDPQTGWQALSFCAMLPDPRQPQDLNWCGMQQIEYRLVPTSNGLPALARITRDLQNPTLETPPQTNLLLEGALEFKLLLNNGDEWMDEWERGLPSGADLMLTGAVDGQPFPVQTRVLIPAAVSVKRQGQQQRSAPGN